MRRHEVLWRRAIERRIGIAHARIDIGAKACLEVKVRPIKPAASAYCAQLLASIQRLIRFDQNGV